jgi:ribosomal protein L33
MAKKGNRAWVWMVPVNKDESNLRLRVQRNKANEGQKLTLSKYDKTVRRHIKFIETK